MFINITLVTEGLSRDIIIDSQQKISEALTVLRQSGKLPMGQSPEYYRSLLNERLVSAYKTFAEESIFDGDILTAIK